MIRAVCPGQGGRSLLVLGLEAENIRRLRDGRPIRVDGQALGVSVDVEIHYGETLQHVAKDLRKAGLQLPEQPLPKTGLLCLLRRHETERTRLLICFDAEITHRLKTGKPITADGTVMKLPIDVLLVYGATLADAIVTLEKLGFRFPAHKLENDS